jgi:import inner membrane translocase subunit TIM22
MAHDPFTPIHDLAILPRKSNFFANDFAPKTRFRSWLSGNGAHLRAQLSRNLCLTCPSSARDGMTAQQKENEQKIDIQPRVNIDKTKEENTTMSLPKDGPGQPSVNFTLPESRYGAVGSSMSIYESIMTQKLSGAPHYTPEAALHRPVPFDDETNELSLGHLTRRSLPFFMPWNLTAGPSELPPDFSWISNSCGGKAAIGVFGGGVMGLLMGVFLGAMSDSTPPVQVIAGKEVPQAPLREQVKVTFRATADKSLYWCRNFAFITGVFGGSECLVEKFRGKHDVWNSVASGCITGAAMQAKSGPQAAAIGCGGFGAFSLVIDSFMGH